MGFVEYLLIEVAEEKAWEVWLHKDFEGSFESFKSKRIKAKPIIKTDEEEEQQIKEAMEMVGMVVREEVSDGE